MKTAVTTAENERAQCEPKMPRTGESFYHCSNCGDRFCAKSRPPGGLCPSCTADAEAGIFDETDEDLHLDTRRYDLEALAKAQEAHAKASHRPAKAPLSKRMSESLLSPRDLGIGTDRDVGWRVWPSGRRAPEETDWDRLRATKKKKKKAADDGAE